jgi:hypothetical protein
MRVLLMVAVLALSGCTQPRLGAGISLSTGRITPSLSTSLGGVGLSVTP